MFPVPYLLLLGADTTAAALHAWVPRRMAELRVPGIAVAFYSRRSPGWTWTHGVANVLTRHPVDDDTRWPVGGPVSREQATGQPSTSASLASAHARLGALLPPGLVILGVWAGIAWLALVPVSLLIRKRRRFGRWHEVLALLVAAPVAWIYLGRLGGPDLASYFTAMALVVSLVPFALAAWIWKRSRVLAVAPLVGMFALVWTFRAAALPLPGAFDRASRTMSLTEMQEFARAALDSDSLARTALGLHLEDSRWVARAGDRGTDALLIVVPAREAALITVANAAESGELLRAVAESVLP